MTTAEQLDELISGLKELQRNLPKFHNWKAASMKSNVEFALHGPRTEADAVAVAKAHGGEWVRKQSEGTGWLESERGAYSLTIFFQIENVAPKVLTFPTPSEEVANTESPQVCQSFFTFGQNHFHRYKGRDLNKDTVVKITALDPRARMVELFGMKWSWEYAEAPDPNLFPGGIVEIE